MARIMNKQPIVLLALSLEAGCSDYQLKHLDTDTAIADTGYGIGYDSGDSSFEVYDSCNPYDNGWDVRPQGNNRLRCVGIEDAVLNYLSIGEREIPAYSTQIYLRECQGLDSMGDIDFLDVEVQEYNVDGSLEEDGLVSSLGFGIAGNSSNCGYENGFAQYYIYPFEIDFESHPLITYQLWIGAEDEGSYEDRAELQQSTEPLYGSIDCRNARNLEECTAMLYN